MSDTAFTFAVLIMAGATFATRIAGVVFMAQVKPSPGVERFLEGLSVSVIAALVATALISADIRSYAAVAVATLVVLTTRNMIGALIAGMLVAAMFSAGLV